ncbi:MAG: DNA mismatch repair endonuclease MutL [Bacteroidales bacterium]|nr:DNA mismatch repair endonuclease MutL [Bacteroidales bacterium]
MSDIIQLLPDSVANQIAAGEVIQRPASVIKELVENAVDAGAKSIQVLITDAGRTAMQVIDDGKGMSETDARLSFERHATSKIKNASDLFALRTMGFRGEALASIAAVAQIELKTRQPMEEVGTHLSISGSRFMGQEPCSCPVGSNFLVENLFYNVPARRKFLKSNSTELTNIVVAFERIALVYPDIAFTLYSNGTEMLNLKAGGLRQRIADVFGKKMDQDLIPVEVETTMCKIKGFVGKPEASRKKGAQQFFFVNGRYMKHPYFNKAVMASFERLVPVGEQVPYFIYFTVNPEDIDVNIHPTKTEIKFENEQAIWQILAAAVKESIGVFNDVPSIDFDVQGQPDIPVFDHTSKAAVAPKVEYNPHYNPFKESAPVLMSRPVQNWEELYENLQPEPAQDEGDIFSSSMVTNDNIIEEKSPVHYQYKGKYIMTAVKSGLMIIDQYRAHVRILYEKYLRQLEQKKGDPQKVLFPEVIQLAADEAVVLETVINEMGDMGFELNTLGGNSFAVNAIPSGLEGINVERLIHDMLASAKEKGAGVKESVNHKLALSLARHAAVPQGQVLSNQEMESIVNELFACENVNYTPDGKNVLCILKQQEIDHLLG